MIETRDKMVAKTGGEKARTGEARGWGWEQTNWAKAKADRTTSMNSMVMKSRGSRPHVEQPRVTTPMECKS
jgi:hypothetical protein